MAARQTLSALYRDTVLDHSRNPRNFHALPAASHHATGHNPLCGDRVTLYLQLNDDGAIDEASFEASGCAISVASASILTELVRGKNVAAAGALVPQVYAMLAGEEPSPVLGDLAALSGVRGYPSRVRCATLPWRTLQAALGGETTAISTEKET